jgi:hypothetical protein
MTRSTYSPEILGKEFAAPSGYYQPLEEKIIDHGKRRLLYTLGTACIEASCCGVGSWDYVRVEGYVIEPGSHRDAGEARQIEIDTVEDAGDKALITKLLLDMHPGVRIEFR